jgi:CheY-like chemotaxis protein
MNPDRAIPRVLLVEDEHIVAAALSRGLRVCGAEVIGPAATVPNALALIEATPAIDGALVDINLRGVKAYDVVDALIARRVPTVLTTGYETSVVPSRYRDVPVLQKPFDPADALAALFPTDPRGET